MYKMIVCDLDETLLNNQKKIDPATVTAIKAALAKGVYFVPNTGRSYLSVDNVLTKLGMLHEPDTYIISYNGGITVENSQHRVLAMHPLEFDTIKQIFNIGIAAGVCLHVYAKERDYIANMDDNERAYLNGRANDWVLLDEPNIDFLKNEPLFKIIFQADLATRQQLAQKVQAEVKQPLAVTYSSDRYVEFNHAGVNKGAAALELGGKLGIKPEEIIAIGDNSNDIPMLKAAGLGVSVANGTDEAKAASNFVTTANNDHDAVAEVIQKFIL
ncbi:HAD superfamily hydrolase [Lactobacillus selangorensis]|uniref:HAD superfamily hydrolase n=1 Tax=Lactobacillus selangorensis TaxID=81857 RepID=A0A0R2FPX6_9LACO|nr:Cof-type HAD-IIB family hydrolase [Lactobacillus selangorensis]KRN28016.1 HAD superfamily hydrolase [Lactobacillus selangorensis]KRN30513.1 HAD superfamily hydrolase [Lactobacillus selangorensis]